MSKRYKQSRWIKVWFLLLSLFMSGKVQGVSFDCSKAKTAVENMICSNAELSKLDEELSSVYNDALKIEEQPNAVKETQKQWLKKRNVCNDIQSIAKLYSDRIKELTIKKQESLEKKESKESTIPNICEYCIQLANNGRLNDFTINPIYSPDIPVPDDQYFGNDSFKYGIDINNDGIKERVFKTQEIYGIFPENSDEKITIAKSWGENWEDNYERWVYHVDFIEYRGVNYIIEHIDTISGSDRYRMSHVSYINPQNMIDVVCQFDLRQKPWVLVKSENHEVCQSVIENKVAYVEFDYYWPGLTKEEVEKSGLDRWITFSDASALIDINNDGKKDIVTMLEFQAGSAYPSIYPVILNKDRTSVDTNILSKFFPNEEHGWDLKPFLFNNTVYLDGKRGKYRKIFKMTNNKIKQICEFGFKTEYFIKRTRITR